jgi:hypothetical protein
MIVPYTDLPYSYFEHLWKGIVKVDYSLINKTSERPGYGDYTIVTINDSRYGNEDNAQLDNYDGLGDFPNEIVLFVRGNEIVERMQCTVIKGYKEKEHKKLLQSSIDIRRSLDCKGFILEPTTEDTTLGVDACLALLQLDNEYSDEIYFNRLGIYAFTSGSQTSNITLRNPRRSVTTAFVASKEKPFIAYIYLKDKTRTTAVIPAAIGAILLFGVEPALGILPGTSNPNWIEPIISIGWFVGISLIVKWFLWPRRPWYKIPAT